MSDHPNLASALAAFQGEMPTVVKSKTAKVPTKSGGSYSYTYADLADVTEIAMPRLSAHGLSFTAAPRLTEPGHYELVGVLRHVSGEREEGALPIKGGTPQELGSSITYARRYLLGSMTGIVTDNDDDGTLASSQRQEKKERRLAASGSQVMSRRAGGGAAAVQPETPKAEPAEPVTQAQMRKLHVLLNERGYGDRETGLSFLSEFLDRPVETSKSLSKDEASRVIDFMETSPRPDGAE